MMQGIQLGERTPISRPSLKHKHSYSKMANLQSESRARAPSWLQKPTQENINTSQAGRYFVKRQFLWHHTMQMGLPDQHFRYGLQAEEALSWRDLASEDGHSRSSPRKFDTSSLPICLEVQGEDPYEGGDAEMAVTGNRLRYYVPS